MSNTIKTWVHTMGGEVKQIETPTDIKVEDFISELVAALHLPFTDSEGNPIAWRLDNRTNGYTLDLVKTLEENSVREDNRLDLIRTVTAGGDGRKIKIQPSGTVQQKISSRQSSQVYNLANDIVVIHTTWIPIIKRGLQPDFTIQISLLFLGVSLGIIGSLLISLQSETISDSLNGLYKGVLYTTSIFSFFLLLLSFFLERNRKKLLEVVLLELDDLENRQI